MSYAKPQRCSSSKVTSHISSALMQSGMSVHNSVVIIFILIPGISSSHFVLWLCLDGQSAMNSCGTVLCSILDVVVGYP